MAEYDKENFFEATDGSIRPRVGNGDPDGYLKAVEFMQSCGPVPIPNMYAPNKPEELLKKGGVKYDQGKLDWSLLPIEPMAEVIKVYTLGANKYERENWRKGMDWHRVFSALMRHAWAWWGGEKYDPVDGQHHLSSVVWCALTLMWYEIKGVGKDTRYCTTSV